MQEGGSSVAEDFDETTSPPVASHVVRSRGAATMERALKVVGQILDEGGEASLRLADVSRRSGVSIGSLYHHFESREGLIRAARERQFLQSLPTDADDVADLLATATTPEQFAARLEQIIRRTQTPERAANRLRRVELIGAAAARPELLEAISATQTMVLDVGEALGEAFRERGWLREGVEPRSLALFVQAVTLGRVLGDLDQRGVDQESWVRLILRALDGMLTLDLSTPSDRAAED
ncbi:MAG TPA: TetR/AcrR family transcriptional regulator [Acidimicrobiales bacterium]|nr:TetR/AcrR family transcriptional regulator [Acidimicrobiales bacterium]